MTPGTYFPAFSKSRTSGIVTKTPSSRSPWTITLGQEWACEGFQVLGMFLTGPLPPPEPLKLFVNEIINRHTAHGLMPFSRPVLGGNHGNSLVQSPFLFACLITHISGLYLLWLKPLPYLSPCFQSPAWHSASLMWQEWVRPLEKRRGAEKVHDKPPQTHTLRCL